MNLIEFLSHLENHDLPANVLVHFTGSSYPLLFFSLLTKYFSTVDSKQLRCVDSMTDIELLKAELSVAFLSNTMRYWFGNISVLDSRTTKKILHFFSTYHGPHQVLFYTDKQEDFLRKHKNYLHVDLSLAITPQLTQKMALLFLPSRKAHDFFIEELFAKAHNFLTLEKTCLLLHYIILMSRPLLKEFFKQWLSMLLMPDKSLFELSSFFFAKRSRDFFLRWHHLQHNYPAQFWISYWSELLFRATYFVKYAHAKKFLEAKKIAYRLPFTLIKNDWKHLTSHELAQAHHLLYNIDFRLKNGGNAFSLDLFYSYFFSDYKT